MSTFHSIGELHSKDLIQEMEANLSDRVQNLLTQGITPRLEILNDNPDYQPSYTYSHLKEKIAHRLGMLANITEDQNTSLIAERVRSYSELEDVHGIIVQLPLLNSTRTDEVLNLIDPIKDVDGLGPNAPHLPATPMAILRLLDYYDIDIYSNRVAVIGRGKLVGKPLIKYLVDNDAKDIHTFDETSEPLDIIKGINDAEIIITATGLPELLTVDLFNSLEPKTLIDAGKAELGTKVVGDVSEELRTQAIANGWNVAPPLGGVGPITIRLLLENTVINAESKIS